MIHKHKKQVSMFTNCILKFRKRQELLLKPHTGEDLHPSLVAIGDTDPMPVVELKGLENMTQKQLMRKFGGTNGIR